MSSPQPYRQPPGYAYPSPYPQPYWPTPQGYRQLPQAGTPGAGHGAQWGTFPAHHGGGDQRLFQVRVTKHTGLVVAFYNQSYTVTGTLAQCEAAIREAQLHNLLAGWWSFVSLLAWNWVALAENLGARKALRRQAAQTCAGPPAWPGN